MSRSLPSRLRVFLFLSLSTVAGVALAQQRGPAPAPRPVAPAAQSVAAQLLFDAGSGPVDAGVVFVQKFDGGQTFKFGEVDIEGRLKSPTLVYFLRRVRAEFAAGDLGHRSFLRELSQTRNGPSFE